MNRWEDDEARLARLLSGARAGADPGVLARARSRIAAAAPVPRGLAWLGTPAALAGACALLVCTTALSFALVRADSAVVRESTDVSALVGDDGSYGLPGAAAAASDAGTSDSGEVTR